jgi:hypothetical protein
MKPILSLLLCAGLFAQDPAGGKPAPAPAPVQQQPAPAKPKEGPQDPKPAPKADAGQGQKPAAEQPKSGAGQPKTDQPKTDQGKTEPPKAGDGKTEPVGKGGKEADGQQGERVVPKGTDPADLAAMRSAEAMLEAERKLEQMLKEGKLTGLDKILPFDELTSWPYEDGLKGMPKRIKDLSGKKVLMTGFMLPIDEVQNIKEFLLVQSLWACCYGQPPDIHGIIRVVMPKGKTTDYFFDPLKIIGTFKVEATVMDGYCVDIFQLHVESIEVIR